MKLVNSLLVPLSFQKSSVNALDHRIALQRKVCGTPLINLEGYSYEFGKY